MQIDALPLRPHPRDSPPPRHFAPGTSPYDIFQRPLWTVGPGSVILATGIADYIRRASASPAGAPYFVFRNAGVLPIVKENHLVAELEAYAKYQSTE